MLREKYEYELNRYNQLQENLRKIREQLTYLEQESILVTGRMQAIAEIIEFVGAQESQVKNHQEESSNGEVKEIPRSQENKEE